MRQIDIALDCFGKLWVKVALETNVDVKLIRHLLNRPSWGKLVLVYLMRLGEKNGLLKKRKFTIKP